MLVYDILQIFHLLVFGMLLALPEYRKISSWLFFSAFVYLVIPNTGYLFDAFFDFTVATIVSRRGTSIGKIQGILLYTLCTFSCLSYLEYPTNSRIIYDSYAIITNGLNLLQLVVMYDGIRQLIRYIHDRVDFNLRISYNYYRTFGEFNSRVER